jgi:periodic tryptophan protein 2
LAAYTNGSFAIYKLFPDQITAIQSFSIGNYKISSVALNPSSTWIGLGIKEAGQLIVWEWKSQSYILNQRGLPHINTALAYNGGKFLATGTQEGEVKLW